MQSTVEFPRFRADQADLQQQPHLGKLGVIALCLLKLMMLSQCLCFRFDVICQVQLRNHLNLL